MKNVAVGLTALLKVILYFLNKFPFHKEWRKGQ